MYSLGHVYTREGRRAGAEHVREAEVEELAPGGPSAADGLRPRAVWRGRLRRIWTSDPP